MPIEWNRYLTWIAPQLRKTVGYLKVTHFWLYPILDQCLSLVYILATKFGKGHYWPVSGSFRGHPCIYPQKFQKSDSPDTVARMSSYHWTVKQIPYRTSTLLVGQTQLESNFTRGALPSTPYTMSRGRPASPMFCRVCTHWPVSLLILFESCWVFRLTKSLGFSWVMINSSELKLFGWARFQPIVSPGFKGY